MKINKAGLRLIQNSEGLYLKAYRCPADVLTIGYGHTGDDVYEGQEITVSEAEALLADDVAHAEATVEKNVTVPLSDNQFSALVSFVFNVGPTAFKHSTLLQKLNTGDYEPSAKNFGRWIYANGTVLRGLITRRAAEKALFETGDPA